MPRNGAGSYTLPLADVVANTTILASWANATLADVAAALSASIAKDGQTQPTANLPMNGFKHTGVAAGNANGQYYRYDEVQSVLVPAIQNHSYSWGGTAGGTVNALTITCSPAPTAYAAGQIFVFNSLGRNTSLTPTLNVNGLGAKAIYSNWQGGGTTVPFGVIPGAGTVVVIYDGTRFRLLNPASIPVGHLASFTATGASQSITNGTLTELTSGWSDETDAGSVFNAANGRFSPVTAGLYLVHFSVSLQSNLGNPTEMFYAAFYDRLDIGVTDPKFFGSMAYSNSASSAKIASVGSMILPLFAGTDYSIAVYHETGTSRSVIDPTRFSAQYIGPTS